MRQYTNKEQTQHLIELGFPRPKYIDIDGYPPEDMLKEYAFDKDRFGIVKCYENYSIGELIEFLGKFMMGIKLMETYEVYAYKKTDDIEYVDWIIKKGELIDALYEACVELKNEGVI